MLKNNRIAGLILLVIVALVAAACGGGGDAGGDADSASSGGGAALNQEFSGSGITFMYPEGWLVEEDDEGVSLANTQEVMDLMKAGDNGTVVPAGGFGVALFSMNIDDLGLGAEAGVNDVVDMLKRFMADDETTVGDVESLTLGGRDAARASVDSNNGDGWIYGVVLEGREMAILVALSANDESGNWVSLLDSLAASVSKVN